MGFNGETWNESSPVNADLAADIDDYIRDVKIGVRSRMENEHVWKASQSATGSDGQHKFITLAAQTATPGLVYGTSTQSAGIFADTNNTVNIVDKTGNVYPIVMTGKGLVIGSGTGTYGAIPYITSGGGITLLAAGTSGYILTGAGAAAPTWSPFIGFGSWAAKSDSVVYQAATDGFVVGFGAVANGGHLYMYTDSAASPTTVRLHLTYTSGGSGTLSGMMPVKKGDYWTANGTGEVWTTLFWIPLGS